MHGESEKFDSYRKSCSKILVGDHWSQAMVSNPGQCTVLQRLVITLIQHLPGSSSKPEDLGCV